MSAIDSLFDLASHIGFEAIDAEISVWIEAGEFDEEVKERAKEIDIEPHSYTVFAHEELQMMHRAWHKDGPWGWEYCFRCTEGNP